MKQRSVAKVLAAGAVSAMFVMGLCSCSGGDVAATVNGEEIKEQTITDYIDSLRTQMGITDDDSWGQWLVSYGYTPEDIRSDVIDSYVQRTLIVQGADEKGITVEDSEIDEQVQSIRDYYDSDEEWAEALEQAGLTEESYREEIEVQLKAQKLEETFASDEEPSDEEVLEECKTYAEEYNGAKRSSHILFSADDEATAQEVLDKINSGELDFAEAAQQYSTDTGSAEDGGDVGWDKMTSFVDAYQEALDGLEVDQVSGLVTSDYGIHIIKCTDEFTAPDEVTSADQLPSDWVDEIKENLKTTAESEAYEAWYDEYKENADIQINDMPEGLSYDIDLTPYQTDDSSSSDGTTDSGDGTTEDGSTDATVEVTSEDGTTTESTAEVTTEEGSDASGTTSESQ